MIPSEAPDANALEPRALAALLHFYADAGVDWLLEEEPVDRVAEFAAQQQARAQRQASNPGPAAKASDRPVDPRTEQQSQPRPQSTAPMPVPDAEAVAKARQAAGAARTMEELRTAILAFDHCNLKRSARQSLFASGNPQTGIVIVGAVPGAEEDADGVPFAGREGQLLDRMLGAIGLTRDKVVLVNALPWRPPGNRKPYQAEMDICRPFLERQIELSAPKAMLILGNFAARYLIDPNASLHLMRGQWNVLPVGETTVPALTSLHPQDLLLAPQNKRLAWQDLLRFRQKLGELKLI